MLASLVNAAEMAEREPGPNNPHEAVSVLSEAYQIAAKTLTKASQTDLAWIAAERALAAARRAEMPLLVVGSAYQLGLVFLRAGSLDEAKHVSLDAAEALADRRFESPELTSGWGALHLTAVIAAARQDERVEADEFLNRAEVAAERLGEDRNDLWTAFGPTNVRIHAVSVAAELGDAGEAVRLGESIDVSGLPPGLKSRRATLLVELARGYAQRRMDAAAVNTLVNADTLAPEAVRANVFVHEMLRELLKREHKATTPQLRDLARRAGVLA